MRWIRLSGRIVPALAALVVLGCGGRSDTGGLRGVIVIDGSSTVFRISKAAQISYARDHPNDVRVLVNNSGTGGGFGKYFQGEVDIIDASRPAKPEEEEQAHAKGLDWTRFTVGYDGITVVVNPQNTFCDALTVEQLRAIFQPGSTITNWNQVDPSFPDQKMTLFTPDNDSGTFEFFTEAVIGEKNAQRKDVQASSEDNVLVTGVAGDRGALGYFGYAYYSANAARLKAVAIQPDADSPAVAPSRETVLDGSYRPLSRPLFLYVKNASMARPEVADFLRYYITHIDELASRAGYVPPKPEDQAENLAKLPGASDSVASESAVAAAEVEADEPSPDEPLPAE